jgi:predicted DNA-binding transcriptional regulator YafY
MPKNRHQLERFERIIELLNLRKGVYVSTEEILSNFDVKRSTIMEDISLLRNPPYNAPIVYDKKQKGFCLDGTYKMPRKGIGLSREDMQQLKFAVRTLRQFQHLDVFKNLEGVIQKIENSVKYRLDTEGSVSDNIFFEPVPFYQGTQHLSIFLKAIDNHRVIAFDYQSFKSSEARHHIIEPYFLQEHSHRWYIIGRACNLETSNTTPTDSMFTFALDRVLNNDKLEIQKAYFKPNIDFNCADYFHHTFGITRSYAPNDVQIIELQFAPIQAQYFESKPFHEYTILNRENNGTLTVQLQLVVNYELIRKIVGMGSEVKVLKPQNLIDAVKQAHEKALKQYEF